MQSWHVLAEAQQLSPLSGASLTSALTDSAVAVCQPSSADNQTL
jgi:hypothetical protein